MASIQHREWAYPFMRFIFICSCVLWITSINELSDSFSSGPVYPLTVTTHRPWPIYIPPVFPTCNWENQHTRPGKYSNSHGHFCKCRFSYYPNSSATFQIILGGDIEPNPGPTTNHPKASCGNCERPIRRDHRRSSCSICNNPLHLKCTLLPAKALRPGQPIMECLCSPCAAQILPFTDTSLSSNCSTSVTDSSDSSTDIINTSNLNSHSMLLLNAGSVRHKIDELTNLIFSINPRPCIIGITESWLNSKISDSELSMNDNFCIFRQDRPSRGGGVCLLIHRSLKPHLSPLTSQNCEMVWVDCLVDRCYFKICCYYRPPYRTENTIAQLSNSIAQASSLRCPNGSEPKILVMGDFNVNLLDSSHYLYDDLSDFVSDHNLHQFVNQPTFHSPNSVPSLLDHVYSNDPTLVTQVNYHSPLGACHHSVIQCYLSIHQPKPASVCRTIWQYNKADWAQANEMLSDFQLVEGEDANCAWDRFHSFYMNVIDQCVPKKTVKCKAKDPPWLNGELRKLCRKKHMLFRKWKKSMKDEIYIKYKSIRNKLCNRIKHAKRVFFDSLLDNASPSKRFWSYCKSRTGKSPIPDNVNHNGVSASTPAGIANIFCQFFTECFNDSDVLDSPTPSYNYSTFISHCSCYSEDICSLIMKLGNTSAAGVDGITSLMLKRTVVTVSPILCYIFNLSLSTGRIPDAWKLSRVVPVFKSGDPHAASNYRPISLQPICCKLLEKIIHRHILHHLSSNNILTPRQFGFLPNSSTTDALITALHEWYGHLEERKSVAVALFDLSKAFDRVPHRPLLNKLRAVGVNGPLLSWFRSYLSNRTQMVSVHGVNSISAPVLSGVPQGSVLGPLLFLIYVNDLCLISLSIYSSLILYADDSTLCKPINNPADVAAFQRDINAIHEWFSQNHLTANTSKTKVMVISTKKDPFPDITLTLNNQLIERVSSAKFLGFFLTDKLSWNLHVDLICKKARKTIGFIHRSFCSAPINTRRSLYLALVRPILEYGCTTWHPLNKTLTNRLESTQRFACRVILQQWNLSHEELLLESNLPSLSGRRDVATLCHLFKIFHGLCSSPNPFRPHPRPNLRHLNSCAVEIPFSRLTLCQKSFYPYASSLWNYLPEAIVKSNSLQSFKLGVQSHLL